MTRLLLAIPTLDTVPSPTLLSYMALCLTAIRDRKLHHAVEVNLGTISGSNYSQARNTLVAQARDLSCTQLLFLDSDMVVPIHTISTLLSHHVPIVGANYCRRNHEPPTLMGLRMPADIPDRGVLSPYFHLPLGVMLISMKVFDAIGDTPFDYRISGKVSEDTEFCARARDKGFTIWCDTTLTREVGHVGMKIYRPTTGART